MLLLPLLQDSIGGVSKPFIEANTTTLGWPLLLSKAFSTDQWRGVLCYLATVKEVFNVICVGQT